MLSVKLKDLTMPNWLNRLAGGRMNAPQEAKSLGPQTLFTLTSGGDASWSRKDFASLAKEGFVKNPVVYRCVRMVAEAANRVPLSASEGGKRLTDHPVLDLLNRPNPRQSGTELFEAVYSYLQTAGNAYLEAAIVNGEVRGLYGLRPDRMRVVAGNDGWPTAYTYTAGGRTIQLSRSRRRSQKCCIWRCSIRSMITTG
jgi:phage portal protein BeeE